MLRGATKSGRRTRRASAAQREMEPKMVEVLWWSAAESMALEEGVGSACRWKYHCETVAAEVALARVSEGGKGGGEVHTGGCPRRCQGSRGTS
jgi:hypothetical protein